MEKKMTFNYFYGTEADQFSFYRIPKALFTDSYFKDYWSAKHGAIRVFKSNARETWCVILVSES